MVGKSPLDLILVELATCNMSEKAIPFRHPATRMPCRSPPGRNAHQHQHLGPTLRRNGRGIPTVLRHGAAGAFSKR